MKDNLDQVAAPEAEETMLLVLRMSGEVFGLPISIVDEVIDPIPITPVPHAPPHVPGLINVRGAVVPLINLARRLNMAEQPPLPTSRLVVVDMAQGGRHLRLALQADAVEEVLDHDPATLETLPERGSSWPLDCFSGALRRQDDLILVLNPQMLFRPEGEPRPGN